MDELKRGQSIPEFAASCGVSRAFIFKAIKQGWGPKITKFGRRSIVLRDDGDNWIEGMREKSIKEAA